MRVLLFAYYFPPDGGAGTQRPASFARHLPAHGVDCTVVTRTPPPQRNFFEPPDEGLLTQLRDRSRIVRTASSGDDFDGWLREVHATGDRAIRGHRPDVLLVTMSPFRLWPVVEALASAHGLPVVADLRDPWALDGVLTFRTWWHWRAEFARMRAMLRRADGVVANTPECRRLFLEAAPRRAADRIAVIPNGWDAEDFAPPAPRVEPGDQLRLVFTGSFLCAPLYERDSLPGRLRRALRHRAEPIVASGRTPVHLLQALRLLRERGSAAAAAVRFVSVGQTDPWLERCVAESGVQDRVELTGYQPHAATVAAMRTADALFLTLHGLPPGHRSRIVPGKTYEYLATGRPILGALPAGDARELVDASGRGFCADPTDAGDLAQALERLHARWRQGEFAAAQTMPRLAEYERAHLAGRLAAFLSRVAGRA
ncbi:MAG: glycosyltransferase family 4 protein [Planctomycetota bacterium]